MPTKPQPNKPAMPIKRTKKALKPRYNVYWGIEVIKYFYGTKRDVIHRLKKASFFELDTLLITDENDLLVYGDKDFLKEGYEAAPSYADGFFDEEEWYEISAIPPETEADRVFEAYLLEQDSAAVFYGTKYAVPKPVKSSILAKRQLLRLNTSLSLPTPAHQIWTSMLPGARPRRCIQ